jgi:hypothetical protein
MRIIGIDPASPDGDETVLVARREGMTHVCVIPAELGNVTDLEVHGDRVVATTESGVPMIAPVKR